MEDDEKKHNINDAFLAKIKSVIEKMNENEGRCILCMKPTNNHVVIVSGDKADGSDLGFGSPEQNKMRMLFATVCKEHTDEEGDISEKIRVAIEIGKLTNKAKYVENMDTFLNMED